MFAELNRNSVCWGLQPSRFKFGNLSANCTASCGTVSWCSTAANQAEIPNPYRKGERKRENNQAESSSVLLSCSRSADAIYNLRELNRDLVPGIGGYAHYKSSALMKRQFQLGSCGLRRRRQVDEVKQENRVQFLKLTYWVSIQLQLFCCKCHNL